MIQVYLVILTGLVTAAYIVAKAVLALRPGRHREANACTGCAGCPTAPSRGRGRSGNPASASCSPSDGCH